MKEPDLLDSEALYTPRQLRDRSGICTHRIRAAIREGSLPAFKIGTWNRIRWCDFERWVDSHRFVPPDPSEIDREVEARVQAQLRRESELNPKNEAARSDRTAPPIKKENDNAKSTRKPTEKATPPA